MDNFTHSLVGWTLGQTGLKQRTRKGLAALVLGANSPDIDVFFGWVPWAPLATHRGVAHSLLGGVLILPPLLAGLLWLVDRWQSQRGADFAGNLPMRFGWLVALAYLGCLTHPLLDWQNTYAVQFFSPFDRRWYHNDALFIVDIWVWAGLALALWSSRRRERRGGAWRTPAVAALASLVVYIAANGAVSALARRAPQIDVSNGEFDVVVASPPPVLFWRRDVVWRHGHEISGGEYDPLHSLTKLIRLKHAAWDGMNTPIVRQAAASNRYVVSFMRWSILPEARTTVTTCGTMVRFSDARYRGLGSANLTRTVFMPIMPGGC